jgi:hypothetical protein
MKKVTNMFLLAGIVVLFSAACGNGNKPASDSTATVEDTAGLINPDTVPAAQAPPGAINPGEDSSRFGTGAGDSSKHRPRR